MNYDVFLQETEDKPLVSYSAHSRRNALALS